MAAHEKFDFKTLEAVKAKAQELGAGLSFRDDPVSYTHLDVYKRQAMGMWKRCAA